MKSAATTKLEDKDASIGYTITDCDDTLFYDYFFGFFKK